MLPCRRSERAAAANEKDTLRCEVAEVPFTISWERMDGGSAYSPSSASCVVLQGAKLQQGHIPLYVRGDDANARQFPSLHAVQRHMADTGRFKMAWEDNEDEYEDFYNFDAVPIEEAEAGGISRANLQRV